MGTLTPLDIEEHEALLDYALGMFIDRPSATRLEVLIQRLKAYQDAWVNAKAKEG